MPSIRLTSAAKYYEELPHQSAAFNWLEEQISADTLAQFAELYRAAPPSKIPPPARPNRLLLNVPYEYQNDTPTGYRECFSSSCAMVAEYYGVLSGGDDAYNRIRSRYGDSTSIDAQIQTLKSLGLNATFHQNGSSQVLEQLLRNRQPVPVGWLHKGSVDHPSGSGHWSVVIGADSRCFYHNDPNGEASLVQGGYVSTGSTAGKGVAYSRANWLRRWSVEGESSGWYLNVSKA